MATLSGPVIVKQNNVVILSMHGSWNFSLGVPVSRFYGQGKIDSKGSVEPGSGYLGSNKGTAQSASGSFNFVVDQTGEAVYTQLLALQTDRSFFTLGWPIGDPAAAVYAAMAIDCHWDRVAFNHDGPNGRYEISGELTAGMLEYMQ
jgi:hypothetical protein